MPFYDITWWEYRSANSGDGSRVVTAGKEQDAEDPKCAHENETEFNNWIVTRNFAMGPVRHKDCATWEGPALESVSSLGGAKQHTQDPPLKSKSTMRSLCLFLLLLFSGFAPADPPDLVGHWVGKISADSAKMLAKAKTPEHKKLLRYTIDRLGNSTLTLDLNANKSFRWFFADGYAPDEDLVAGKWQIKGDTLVLVFQRKRPVVQNLIIGKGTLKTKFYRVEGLTTTFKKR